MACRRCAPSRRFPLELDVPPQLLVHAARAVVDGREASVSVTVREGKITQIEPLTSATLARSRASR